MRRAAALALAMLLAGSAPAAERTPKPQIEPARGGVCVAPPEEMRRNHMDLLRHSRDETVHKGDRKTKASLVGCVECHASRATGSVAAGPKDFCVSCHAYAAVKVDCFECHASRPRAAAARAAR